MTAASNDHTTELPPMYDPTQVEPVILKQYLETKAYAASPDAEGDPYAVVIPPPNVTSVLHVGHALNSTLQDVLVRYHRMRGFNTLWMPGTDHAGIATQTIVDKRLQQAGEDALKEYKQQELEGNDGRGQFIEKVQAWKDEYEERITNQLKEMGCSCDWDRQRFTMDDQCAKAVREAFFQLFKDGLIYRGKRLVNWDPVSQTALADDEVEMEDIDGNFYYMKYPIVKKAADGIGGLSSDNDNTKTAIANGGFDGEWIETGDFATVATTRPETMLGDTAVAVNPNDEPRAKYIGQFVKLPIVNRVIPIVGDDYVVIPDSESDDSKARMASGFLKVTPAHDPNDYEIGGRHDLAIINVMAPDASISIGHGWPAEENPSENSELKPFIGLAREEARKQIVKWFKANDLMGEVKPYRHAVGHSYRSHVPIEPYYTDQWYVKVTDDKLKGAALRAMSESQRQPSDDLAFKSSISNQQSANSSGLTFTPDRYAKTFQNWHENIRDWCISRQLWWGHRIPVWSVDVHGENIDGTIKSIRETVIDENGLALFHLINREDKPLVAVDFSSVDPLNGGQVFICFAPTDTELDAEAVDKAIAAIETQWSAIQDPDVLDTWFSSALWPLSTLGWPNETDELAKWNPTSVLCTAREIITLWVSRMVMFNRYFKGGDLPFNDVFIHAMIQDGHGQKMSKSLGNGVDPMDIIHSHGADAMRYTLTKMTTHTQDVRLPVDMVDPHTGETFSPEYTTGPGGVKVAAPLQERNGKSITSSYGVASGKATPTDDAPLARNTSEKFDEGQRFANKTWNAFRFALSNLEGLQASPSRDGAGFGGELQLADRWILNQLTKAIQACDTALAGYNFSDYATAVYDFFWRDLCDWYIEIVKKTVKDTPAQQRVIATCLDASLRLMHPMMPFITERLWQALSEQVPASWRGIAGFDLPSSEQLIHAAWPAASEALIDGDAERDFELIREIVIKIREARTAYKIPPKQEVEATTQAPAETSQLLLNNRGITQPLTNCVGRGVGPKVDRPAGSAAVLIGEVTVFLHDVVDVGTERARLEKLLAEKQKQVKTFEGRLSNEKYVNNAPAHLVQETRDQHAAAVKELEQVQQQMDAL